ncbi:MAG: MBL fold metallo-hydrolase [Alphaproteobacteria bacterium]|nr:MBL fold metallo-hydrolase [Alphaproteobacteria bacterium]MCW5741502.1 MBL fold metallo-hydrolase [Alphaproteobacteria bacterium]
MDAVKIGDATITRIEETYEPNFDAARFFSDWRPEIVEKHYGWMLPDHYDPASGMIKLSVHSWLITVGGKRILIDGCVGNHKPRPLRKMWDMMNTPYLERLAAAGVRPEQVDIVMCTHLHMDHVGWNTRLENGRWVPTFPNAKYVFSRADYDHYLKLDSDPATGPVNQGSFRDSVIPIVEARLSQMVDGAHTVDEHLSLDPRPGHTPGTVAINLASRGQKALFCGDILHHAIQVYHPEWNSFACADQVNARRSRRQVLEDCAGSGALLMPAHFGAPFVCRVDPRGEGFTPRFGA